MINYKFSKSLILIFIAVDLMIISSSCKNELTPEQKIYFSKIEKHRMDKDHSMKESDYSPFNHKGKIKFHPLNYFDINPSFVFKSKLYPFESQDTVIVFGTKGDERKLNKIGYVKFKYQGKDYKINVYEGKTNSGETYQSIWFTDKTTNKESYGVGRYIDFEKKDNPDYIYTIDFNLAYNPYCAYSPDYSCAIPTKEDYLDIAVTAGEKKFHD